MSHIAMQSILYKQLTIIMIHVISGNHSEIEPDMGKKRRAKVVESDMSPVNMVKNCRIKWHQNLIKIVESTLKFYRKWRSAWVL